MLTENEKSLPSTRFDLAVRPGAPDDYEQWRWGISPLFDLEVPQSDAPADFYLTSSGHYFAEMSVSRTRSSATVFRRNARVIARAGLDSITVQTYTDGRHRVRTDKAEIDVDPGDILMYDLTRPIEVAATSYANLCLSIPRRLLEPLIGHMDRLHGLVLRKGAPMHGLLAGYMSELDAQDGALAASAAEQVADATARIVAAAAESASGGRTAGMPAGNIVRRIRAEIEAQLGNPDLDPDWLAERFSMSRATLYRLFKEYGGVREHIRLRRLVEAYRALARGGRTERIGVIADRLGFPDQAAFSRAFRAAYGLSPRDVAHIAQNPDLPPPHTAVGFVKLNRWMMGVEPTDSGVRG